MLRQHADLWLAGKPLHLSDDGALSAELDGIAAEALALDFRKTLPPGAQELVARFWRLAGEAERRGLPASIVVEQCRFMFPPL